MIIKIKNKIVLIDQEDYQRVSKYTWRITPNGYVHANSKRKDHPEGKQFDILLHRFIMGAKPGQEVDHINGNKLDNRKSKLRFATTQQNNFNRKIGRDNKSGYKGVCWHKGDKKFNAQIQVNRKMIFLGGFDDPKKAAEAYNEAAMWYHGKFARLN